MKPPKEVKDVSEEEKQADYYKGFRSAVVLAWVFCNFALGAVVLSAAGLENFDNQTAGSNGQDLTQSNRSLIYMQVVLWSVAALSSFKFVGAMWFLVVRLVSFCLSGMCRFSSTNDVNSSAVFDLMIVFPSALQLLSCVSCLVLSYFCPFLLPVDSIPLRARSGMERKIAIWYNMHDDLPAVLLSRVHGWHDR
jgi:hypothetical protein